MEYTRQPSRSELQHQRELHDVQLSSGAGKNLHCAVGALSKGIAVRIGEAMAIFMRDGACRSGTVSSRSTNMVWKQLITLWHPVILADPVRSIVRARGHRDLCQSRRRRGRVEQQVIRYPQQDSVVSV